MTTRFVPTRSSAALMTLCLAFTGFVIVAVNILIYRARIVFGQNNPDYIAVEPPTISRAISDPIVGEPFAEWMAICAPVLFVGVAALAIVAWRELRRGGQAIPRRDYRIVTALCLIIVSLQGLASIGMVLLSHYRFPDFDEMHMAGSYLFFFSQAFVVVFGELLGRRLAAQPRQWSLVTARMARFRRLYVWVPIILGVAYLALFVLKGFDLGAINEGLYIAYTITEPLLISSFLGYVLAYHFDLWSGLRSYLRD
ncbi:Frag1/DRAM/Sfk1 family protein [Shimia gijangensis]|uniref:Frag1/DRAM/Sfk1 family protein n=1 Tax=Shimia gijangensis TaxID=1470563 RepID=A0A1M6JTH3_9RHOB|nr:hypothetical protein [Shimia gijangensis]SHJ50024.1 Frag1/DRAM/Sfk1 family protein [Shimia gijangensis]